jgi:hypothetical protein
MNTHDGEQVASLPGSRGVVPRKVEGEEEKQELEEYRRSYLEK